MKALIYSATNEVVYREEPDPIPGEGEVLIKVAASGICGSDMHAYHGKDARRVPPLILGHEVAGTVVSGPCEGMPVVINPLMTCGRCALCDQGYSHLCVDRELIGMRLAGAYAEYVTIAESNLIELSPDMSFVKASLTEPTATALHALNLARIQSSRPLAELKALVIGGGAVGLLAALRHSVAEHVGCQVHDPLNDPALDAGAFGLVIDAVGGGVTRKTAMAAIKPGGILVHIGLMDAAGELDFRKLTLFEITLVGVYCYTPADVRAAAQTIEKGKLGDLSWVETRPLSEGAQAFRDLDEGRTAAAKIVLIP